MNSVSVSSVIFAAFFLVSSTLLQSRTIGADVLFSLFIIRAHFHSFFSSLSRLVVQLVFFQFICTVRSGQVRVFNVHIQSKLL